MPQAPTGKSRILLVIIIALAAVVGAAGFLRSAPAGKDRSPFAQAGYLDLSGWNFDTDGIVKLDGTWEFYWGQLLTPADFLSADQRSALPSDGFANVPSAWNHATASGEAPDKGVATYRLRIKLATANLMYGLKTTSVRMSNRIFVDGFEVGKSGNPAASSQDGYAVGNTPYVTTFRPQSSNLEIIVQAADFDYKVGGIVQSIYLGQQNEIFAMAERFNFINEFLAAALFITGLYYLFVFLGRRRDVSVLYYSAYTITFAFFELAYGEKIIMQLLPQFPAIALMKMQEMMLYASVIFSCLFVNKITKNLLPRWFAPSVVTVLGGYMLIFPLLPLGVSTSVENLFLLLGLAVYACMVLFLALALIRKQYGDLDRIGVSYLLVAFLLVLIFFANGVLYINNLLNDNYVGYGALLFFTLIIPLMLSRQYNNAYSTVEEMSVQLLALDKLKDEFLTNTSHELRTPLNGIINILGVVIESSRNLSPGQQQNLQVVVTAARRLHHLINDILDISNLKNGEIQLVKRPVDVRSLADVVLHVLSQTRGDKQITFINQIPTQIPPVFADVERLKQIFYNLIGNAIKFTEHGQVEIGADILHDQAEIWVRDTGCGIPKDQLEAIFQHFYQVDAAETREVGGTGLGLSITKTLVELHGGSIWARSQVGVGSQFTFTIPLCREHSASTYIENITGAILETAATIYELTSAPEGSNRRYSVLVADDDPASLTALFNILDNDGHHVKAVTSGAAVLQELERQHRYDLVILDVMMPKISGYEILKRIRLRFQLMDLPVLLLTAKARPEDLQAGFAAGANDYISKPFEALELKARVRTLVQLKESVSAMVTSELAFLQAQIKPHFLFNALSVIAALSTREPQRAKELLYDLADYLRGSFHFENYHGVTTVASELATVRAYISIEKARFRDRLQVEYDIDPSIDIAVPILAIQPLVENAIRHGILKNPQGGTVRLSIKPGDQCVVITVQDDGVGIPQAQLAHLLDDQAVKTGVGLQNIERRLILQYGRGLDIQSVLGQGTTVTMRIPHAERGDAVDAGNLG